MRRLSITWSIAFIGYGILISCGLLRDFHWSFSDTESLLSPSLFFLFSFICIYDLFRTEHISGWDKYVNALPFSPEEIVGAKYIMAFISTAIYQVTIILFGLADCLITRKDFPAHIFIIAAGVLLINSAVSAVHIPISYTFSYLTGFFGTYSLYFIIYFGIFAFFSDLMSDIHILYYQSTPYAYSDDTFVISTYWLCLLASVVLFGLSYYISLKKFKTKDY